MAGVASDSPDSIASRINEGRCQLKVYLNEIDPFAIEWLRNLKTAGDIPAGSFVDTRSIVDVKLEDLHGYDQCHFFAGIGGWPLALQYAGWPDDRNIWTGSCPCQPFSGAGQRKAQEDERHLWPHMSRLIRERRPDVIVGEQVEGAVRLGWLDGISADLEREGYAFGSIVLGAHSVGAPHIRQRIYWVAINESGSALRNDDVTRRLDQSALVRNRPMPYAGSHCEGEVEGRQFGAGGSGSYGGMEHAPCNGRQQRRPESDRRGAVGGCGISADVVDQPDNIGTRLERHAGHGDGSDEPGRIDAESPRSTPTPGGLGTWSDFSVIACRDGKFRRVPAASESEVLGVVDGIPAVLGQPSADLYPLAPRSPGRVGRLKGYGNAIVVPLASEFISIVLEVLEGR